MIRVGIFGANGFIGRHLTRVVVERGHNIVCFARHFPLDFQQEFDGLVEMRSINLREELELHNKVRDITHVVQLINSSNAAIQNNKVIADIGSNLVPHVSFISSCIAADVRSFIFISSGGTVYGRPQSVPIDEEHPTAPLSSYGLVKLTTEQYLQMLCRDTSMGYTVLRVANAFGPGQLGVGGQGLIGTLLQKFKHGQPVTIFGDGLSERDYIFIDDTVDAIVRAIESVPLNDVVNIGSGQGRSVLEVLAAVETALGAPIARHYVADRATDVPSNILNSARAERRLGWKPFTPFDIGVKRTVEWHLRHNRR